ENASGAVNLLIRAAPYGAAVQRVDGPACSPRRGYFFSSGGVGLSGLLGWACLSAGSASGATGWTGPPPAPIDTGAGGILPVGITIFGRLSQPLTVPSNASARTPVENVR